MTTQEAKDRGLLPAEYQEHKPTYIEQQIGEFNVKFMHNPFFDEPRPIPTGNGIMEQIKRNPPEYQMWTGEKMKAALNQMIAESLEEDTEKKEMIVMKTRRAGSRVLKQDAVQAMAMALAVQEKGKED